MLIITAVVVHFIWCFVLLLQDYLTCYFILCSQREAKHMRRFQYNSQALNSIGFVYYNISDCITVIVHAYKVYTSSAYLSCGTQMYSTVLLN